MFAFLMLVNLCVFVCLCLCSLLVGSDVLFNIPVLQSRVYCRLLRPAQVTDDNGAVRTRLIHETHEMGVKVVHSFSVRVRATSNYSER